MYILMSIDTEEDMPRWRPESLTTVENISVLPEFNRRCEDHDIRPTYLTDRPVLQNDISFEIMKRLSENKSCEIGMHLHSWNTPPITPEELGGRATVLNIHSSDIQERKIREYHNYFQQRLGFAPTSYRAGRYGLTSETLSVLAELGYLVDTSIAPQMDYSKDGAPDYRAFEYRPFWINDHPELLEVPITINLVSRLPHFLRNRFHDIPEWTHMKGVLYRLNLARLIWMRPTNYNEREMRQLADFLIIKENRPVFNFMFHSSELSPGHSPYNRTQDEVSAFIDRLFRVTDYLIMECGAKSLTLSEFARIASNEGYPVKPLRI